MRRPAEEHVGVVAGLTETDVARLMDEPADTTRLVAVVDAHASRRRRAARRAHPRRGQRAVRLAGQPVVDREILRPIPTPGRAEPPDASMSAGSIELTAAEFTDHGEPPFQLLSRDFVARRNSGSDSASDRLADLKRAASTHTPAPQRPGAHDHGVGTREAPPRQVHRKPAWLRASLLPVS